LVNPKIVSGTVELQATKAGNSLSVAHTLPFDMGQETLDLELPTLLDHRSLDAPPPSERVQAIFFSSPKSAILEASEKSAANWSVLRLSLRR